jgi:hypothetical protein
VSGDGDEYGIWMRRALRNWLRGLLLELARAAAILAAASIAFIILSLIIHGTVNW